MPRRGKKKIAGQLKAIQEHEEKKKRYSEAHEKVRAKDDRQHAEAHGKAQ